MARNRFCGLSAMRWGRVGVVAISALTVFVGTWSCSSPASNEAARPLSGDDDKQLTNAGPQSGGGGSKGSAAMSGKQADVEEIRRQAAKRFKVDPDDIRVKITEKPPIPGITLFSALPDPKKLGRHTGLRGILQDGVIYTEVEAMSRVVKAWGYGPKRTVSAADFAQVMAILHSERYASGAIANDFTLKAFKASASPKRAAAAALPKETVVDGLPAVEYCMTSEARMNPFAVVTAIIKPDFRVELRAQTILND